MSIEDELLRTQRERLAVLIKKFPKQAINGDAMAARAFKDWFKKAEKAKGRATSSDLSALINEWERMDK